MQIIEFARNVRVPAKTKADVEFWGDIAGQRFRETTRVRFNEEHAMKLIRRFGKVCRIVAEETVETYDDEGEGEVTHTVERAVSEGHIPLGDALRDASVDELEAALERKRSHEGSGAPAGPTERPARRRDAKKQEVPA